MCMCLSVRPSVRRSVCLSVCLSRTKKCFLAQSFVDLRLAVNVCAFCRFGAPGMTSRIKFPMVGSKMSMKCLPGKSVAKTVTGQAKTSSTKTLTGQEINNKRIDQQFGLNVLTCDVLVPPWRSFVCSSFPSTSVRLK